MSEEKKCSKCNVLKSDDSFIDGKALCNKCAEYKKQYREQHREKLRLEAREYYDNNKEKICERKKNYRAENRETILEKKKQYREEHKEEIQNKNKEYYEKNKEKIQDKQEEYRNIKIECPKCKCLVGKYRMKMHEQSLKHQLRLKAYTREEVEETRRNLDYLEL